MMDIKKFSVCNKHSVSVNQQANVCCHVQQSLACDRAELKLIPLFIERVLLDKFYEKYWICGQCAERFSISVDGEIWYDPNLRAFLDDENSPHSGDENFIIEIDDELKSLIRQVCNKCFMDKYGEKIDLIAASLDSLKQRSFNC